jgi:dephospho-CoA kinase
MVAPTVGLTGGIASGKSTVARFFEELGIAVVDADQIAREVVRPGTTALRKIVEAFGEGVLLPDGTLNRPALGEIVFEDEAARKKLNQITHPRIAAVSAERILQASQKGGPYVIYEAALLIENGIHKMLPVTILVAADPETQIRRVVERDGLGRESARARLSSQLSLEEKRDACDIVIENDGTLEDLKARTKEVHEALVRRFQSEENGAP